MKRGIVVEVKKRNAILLAKDGTICSVKLAKNYSPIIGEEMLVAQEVESILNPYFLLPVAFILFIFSMVNETVAPIDSQVAGYVSFDGPSSIEVAVNDEMKVLSAKPFDEQSKQLLSHLPDHISLTDLSSSIVGHNQMNGMINATGEPVYVTTTVPSGDRDTEDKMRNNLLKQVDGNVFHIVPLDQDKRMEALQNGISPGKYVVYMKQLHNGKKLTVQDAKQLTIHQIQNYAKPLRKERSPILLVENQREFPSVSVKQNLELVPVE